jgi:hypothetical protein
MSHLTSNHVLQMLDGALDPGEQQRLSAHVAGCRKCRQELALQRAIARSAKHQPLALPSPRFTATVMRRVRYYESQSALLDFLMKHGIMLAMIAALAILGYALLVMPDWEMTKDKIQTLQPEKKITQIYVTANRELMQQVHEVGKKIIDLASEENAWLLGAAVLIIVLLALFDRLVMQQFMRIRS